MAVLRGSTEVTFGRWNPLVSTKGERRLGLGLGSSLPCALAEDFGFNRWVRWRRSIWSGTTR